MTRLDLRLRLDLFFLGLDLAQSMWTGLDLLGLAGVASSTGGSSQLNGPDYTRESFSLALLQEGSNYN